MTNTEKLREIVKQDSDVARLYDKYIEDDRSSSGPGSILTYCEMLINVIESLYTRKEELVIKLDSQDCDMINMQNDMHYMECRD